MDYTCNDMLKSGMKIGKKFMTIPGKKPKTCLRVTEYSFLQPMMSWRYVPEWKTDMVNRKILLKNANDAGIPTYEHDEPLFRDHREQLHYNAEGRQRVDLRYIMPRRCDQLNVPNCSHLAQHRSSHQARLFGSDPRLPIGHNTSCRYPRNNSPTYE